MTNTQTKGDAMTIDELIEGLNEAEKAKAAQMGYTVIDTWHVKKAGRKFTYIDCGGSGAFLLENATGELYNIKAYGQPDYNKKKKADIGSLATVDAKVLHGKRWNYLR